MSNQSSKCIVAIVSIAVIAISALNKNMDGQVLWLAIISIAGLGGYDVYTELKKTEKVTEK